MQIIQSAVCPANYSVTCWPSNHTKTVTFLLCPNETKSDRNQSEHERRKTNHPNRDATIFS
jgi:hypothetical protein